MNKGPEQILHASEMDKHFKVLFPGKYASSIPARIFLLLTKESLTASEIRERLGQENVQVAGYIARIKSKLKRVPLRLVAEGARPAKYRILATDEKPHENSPELRELILNRRKLLFPLGELGPTELCFLELAQGDRITSVLASNLSLPRASVESALTHLRTRVQQVELSLVQTDTFPFMYGIRESEHPDDLLVRIGEEDHDLLSKAFLYLFRGEHRSKGAAHVYLALLKRPHSALTFQLHTGVDDPSKFFACIYRIIERAKQIGVGLDEESVSGRKVFQLSVKDKQKLREALKRNSVAVRFFYTGTSCALSRGYFSGVDPDDPRISTTTIQPGKIPVESDTGEVYLVNEASLLEVSNPPSD